YTHCPNCGVSIAEISARRSSVRSATVGALVVGLIVAGLAFAVGASTDGNTSSASSYQPHVSYDETPSTEPYVPSTTSMITSHANQLEAGSAGGYVLTATDDSGYSSRVTISVDQPVKVSDASSSSVGRAVRSCSVNSATDAIVPITLQITNTTTRFPSV